MFYVYVLNLRESVFQLPKAMAKEIKWLEGDKCPKPQATGNVPYKGRVGLSLKNRL